MVEFEKDQLYKSTHIRVDGRSLRPGLAAALWSLFSTSRGLSPSHCLLVVAAIGFAAVLLQVRLQRDLRGGAAHWLNLFGIVFALGLFGESFRFRLEAQFSALGAIGCWCDE
jgi:hypothetical protein